MQHNYFIGSNQQGGVTDWPTTRGALDRLPVFRSLTGDQKSCNITGLGKESAEMQSALHAARKLAVQLGVSWKQIRFENFNVENHEYNSAFECGGSIRSGRCFGGEHSKKVKSTKHYC